MGERTRQPGETKMATLLGDSEPIGGGPLEKLKRVEELIESPEFLGADGITHLIYEAFLAKAETLVDSDIHRSEIESLWKASTATPENITKIFQLAIGRSAHTNIDSTSKELAPKDSPTDQNKKLREAIVKTSEWYALDNKLRGWLKKKLHDFLTVSFILGENQEIREFWDKQLRVPNVTKGHGHSFGFCPDIVVAVKIYETMAITTMQTLSNDGRTGERPTHDLVSAYLIGSLPFWRFTVVGNKTHRSDLRILRERTLQETYQNGRPSEQTLWSISWVLENKNLQHVIPERLKTVVPILEAENSAEAPIEGLEPAVKK